MAKGDDAIRKKKNKVLRKRLRNSESAVSARVASIIASKRRRKCGKRRQCEGMCFSLPTPDDPFNDRYNKKKKINSTIDNKPVNEENKAPKTTSESILKEDDRSSNRKYLSLCLRTIHSSYLKDESNIGLLASSWGAQLWSYCSSGKNVVIDSKLDCLKREHLAWLLSTASDIFAKKEKQGQVSSVSPFLLFLVPSQEKALQVRTTCKPLKALGIHTVSLHPGTQLDHQIHGLKSCEPEFLVSTPERLLELVRLQAIDISGVSLLVLDGLKSLVDSGFYDMLKSIKDEVSEEPQVIAFNNSCGDASAPLMQSLVKEPICRLSLDD